jgi:HSP20 family protein
MNIVRRSGVGGPAVETWDPFRMLRDMALSDPFRAMAKLEASGGYLPDVDVKETPEAYVFHADLPGFDEKNVEVSMDGNRITFSGKREEEKKSEKDRYYVTERSWGSFARTFTLPEGADAQKAHAELKNGVLTVSVPRAAGSAPKKIPIAK